jgi:hypothetical protein
MHGKISQYPKMGRDKPEDLEEMCEFIGVCAESNYGSQENCHADYWNCKRYLILYKIELEKRKLWNWWLYS